jgi:hypothetical protein
MRNTATGEGLTIVRDWCLGSDGSLFCGETASLSDAELVRWAVNSRCPLIPLGSQPPKKLPRLQARLGENNVDLTAFFDHCFHLRTPTRRERHLKLGVKIEDSHAIVMEMSNGNGNLSPVGKVLGKATTLVANALSAKSKSPRPTRSAVEPTPQGNPPATAPSSQKDQSEKVGISVPPAGNHMDFGSLAALFKGIELQQPQ